MGLGNGPFMYVASYNKTNEKPPYVYAVNTHIFSPRPLVSRDHGVLTRAAAAYPAGLRMATNRALYVTAKEYYPELSELLISI